MQDKTISIKSKQDTTLDEIRKRLLDLTGRNRLLHFAHSEHGRDYLRIIDEIPDFIFKTLVQQNKTLRFKGTEEKTEPNLLTIGTPPQPDWECQIAKENIQNRHTDRYLQSSLNPEELEARLNYIASKARLAIQETGANILYLALGFLEWKDPRSRQPRTAPLVLIPVKLIRGELNRNKIFEFELGYTDEDLTQNASLAALLASNFNVKLPNYPLDPEQSERGEEPEEYFKAIEELLISSTGNLTDWKLRRYVTLGLFSFSQIHIYEDLNPKNWNPEQTQNTAASRLIESQHADQTNEREEIELTEKELNQQQYPLIFSADASQYAAIWRTCQGEDTVIYGPPGTGKSQTIANLIGVCLYEGKRVLFLAEKQAALEVVASRLKQAGLDGLLLELHSHKTSKRTVIDALRTRMETQFEAPTEYEEIIARIQKTKNQLAEYANILGSTAGNNGTTVQELLGRTTRLRKQIKNRYPQLLQAIEEQLVPSRVEIGDVARKEATSYYCESLEAVTPTIKERWAGVELKNGSAYDVQPQLIQWRNALGNLITWLKREQQLQWEQLKVHEVGSIATRLAEWPRGSNEKVDLVLCRVQSTQDIAIWTQTTAEYTEWLETAKGMESLPGHTWTGKQTQEAQIASQTILGTIPNRKQTLASIIESLHSYQREQTNAEWLHEMTKNWWPESPTTVQRQRLKSILRKLAETKKKILENRDEKYENPIRNRQIIKAAEVCNQLAQTPINQMYRPEGGNNTEIIERIIHTLRTTGWWGRLSKQYRTARQAAQEYFHERQNTRSCIRGLEEIKRWLQNKNWLARELKQLEIQKDQLPDESRMAHWYTSINELPDEEQKVLRRAPLTQLQTWYANTSEILQRLIHSETDSQKVALAQFNQPPEVDRLLKETKRLLELGFNPTQTIGQIESLTDARALRWRQQEKWAENKTLTRLLGGIPWEPTTVDIGHVREVTQLINQLRRLNLPTAVTHRLNQIADGRNLNQFLEWNRDTQNLTEQVVQAANEARKALIANNAQWEHHQNVETELERITACVEELGSLETWRRRNQTKAQMREFEMGLLAEWLENGTVQRKDGPMIAQYIPLNGLAIAVYQKYPVLKQVTAARQKQLRQQLADLDKQIVAISRKLVAFRGGAHEPPAGNRSGRVKERTEKALLENETNKVMRHIPIHELFDRALTAVLAYKPCFMMGPQGVAHYLPKTPEIFDVLIIDEASQMKPELALGAAYRAKQIIVVGDQKQLPPSNFFNSQCLDGEAEDNTILEDSESILEAATRTFVSQTTLRWHYRSRHESLIAFSNEYFYDGRLIIMPSSQQRSKNLGIHYIELSNGCYQSSLNVVEAEETARQAIAHMEEKPQATLAIVAMNRQQRDLIEEAFEQQLKESQQAQEFLARHENGTEPFTIKNLENIQGDERDTIIVSVTYGPDKKGRLATNFGPVNRHQGERRLNVLFTRAKTQLIVISSMNPDKIDLRTSTSVGAQVLKDYLAYAKTGILQHARHTNKPADSDFEIDVRERLENRGVYCEPQVGASGFFIDLGVKLNPTSAQYILGVECDGATYHSSKMARERDLLREQILVNMGWTIERIWSTDWFNDPETEIDRVITRIRQINNHRQAPPTTKTDAALNPKNLPKTDQKQNG